MMDNWGGMGSGGWIIALLVLVVVVAVIIAIVYLVRGMRTGGAGTGSAPPPASLRESPQDVLKRRYAAGEIDREEYEQKLRDLSS
jgi:putative membrane protein